MSINPPPLAEDSKRFYRSGVYGFVYLSGTLADPEGKSKRSPGLHFHQEILPKHVGLEEVVIRNYACKQDKWEKNQLGFEFDLSPHCPSGAFRTKKPRSGWLPLVSRYAGICSLSYYFFIHLTSIQKINSKLLKPLCRMDI